jgi:hypothetical protein
MKEIEVQVIIKNEFGEFFGEKLKIQKESLVKIIESSKGFYKSNGFELHCDDGSFVVFPSDIVKKSILKVVYKDV